MDLDVRCSDAELWIRIFGGWCKQPGLQCRSTGCERMFAEAFTAEVAVRDWLRFADLTRALLRSSMSGGVGVMVGLVLLMF